MNERKKKLVYAIVTLQNLSTAFPVSSTRVFQLLTWQVKLYSLHYNHFKPNFMYGTFGGWRKVVNPMFRFLLRATKSTRVNSNQWLLGLYNLQALRAYYNALNLICELVRNYKSILIISDIETSETLPINRLNFLLNPTLISSTKLHMSEVQFYYNNLHRTLKFTTDLPVFDLVIVCVSKPVSLQYGAFKTIGKVTMGTVDYCTRPDFFDYYLPPLFGRKAATYAIIDAVLLAYALRG